MEVAEGHLLAPFYPVVRGSVPGKETEIRSSDRSLACPSSATTNGRIGLEKSAPQNKKPSSCVSSGGGRSSFTDDHQPEFAPLGTRRHRTETP